MMSSSFTSSSANIKLRTDLTEEDVRTIVNLHGRVYSREYGFDRTFEDYVNGPLSRFARSFSRRERIWIAELDGCVIGCIAIVAVSAQTAQLRWFLLEPEFRGIGLGRNLLQEAVAFCRNSGYQSIMLWTVAFLSAAAHLYREAGFKKVEEMPGVRWGAVVVEERYELALV
jgi:GNAT superfamily N-acetyltransferase